MSGGNRSAKAEAQLECPKCGNVAHIWRRAAKLKPKGHVKHMWCPVCREVTGHVERRPL